MVQKIHSFCEKKVLSQQKRGAGRQEVDLDETSFAGPNEAPVPKNRIENGQKRNI